MPPVEFDDHFASRSGQQEQVLRSPARAWWRARLSGVSEVLMITTTSKRVTRRKPHSNSSPQSRMIWRS